MSMLFVLRRNRSEHIKATLSTSRRRSTMRCRKGAAQPPERTDVVRRGRPQPPDGTPGWYTPGQCASGRAALGAFGDRSIAVATAVVMPPTPPLADSYHPLNAAAPAEASGNETRSFYVFSRVANCGCTIRYTNTLRFNSINCTHLSRAHSSMGFRLPRC